MTTRPRLRNLALSRWDLLALAGYLGLAVFYGEVVPRLPDPVPTHFDALGHANGWTAKATLPWVVSGLALVPWLALWGVGAVTAWWPPRLDEAPPVTIQPLRGLLGLGMAVLMGAGLAFPLTGGRSMTVGLGGFVACLVTGVILLARDSARALAHAWPARAGQGQSYRWGLFYVNPEDSRLWVEKRLGYGWTLNFGRPGSFGVLALLLVPVLVAVAAMLTKK